MPYRGRFAPSPTGPLHIGSLIAATASYLQAHVLQGEWLVRMEDLDTPRTVPGAADHILRTLEHYGFEWHGPVIYQSQRQQAYEAALEQLKAQGMIYGCGCSRKEIADSAHQGIDGMVYPGTCRNGLAAGKVARAWRIRVDHHTIRFEDEIQGPQHQHLAEDIGDFVLKRADGLFAYQLAVVVDDAWQGITHVLRGADLLDSTPRQIFLQQQLQLAQPRYAHVPVATNAAGEKLSKQTLAPALEWQQAGEQLWQVLQFLQQAPPQDLRQASLREIWAWARAHWQLQAILQTRHITHTD
ncbi:MAG TPA: tRNA glutamyl-Q(34) synthetase GluQRS [Methylovorus sp.]|nr:tRNA glutamyl-Q(34) synthetase GluQRS [Methylovorus sp.]